MPLQFPHIGRDTPQKYKIYIHPTKPIDYANVITNGHERPSVMQQGHSAGAFIFEINERWAKPAFGIAC